MEANLPAGQVFVREDRLVAALDEALGRDASVKDRAAHLRVPYITYWRYITNKANRPKTGSAAKRQVSAHFMYAVLRAFPDHSFDYFFEASDPQMVVAA